jgi:hypothetical protein
VRKKASGQSGEKKEGCLQKTLSKSIDEQKAETRLVMLSSSQFK